MVREALIDHAMSIPDLGCGGRCISQELISEAASVEKGDAIIELGPYLGSATAFLSIGLLDSGNMASKIHCIDKWEMTNEYKEKAKRYNRLDFEDGQCFMDVFNQNVSPFINAGVNIVPHKCSVSDFIWGAKDIGLVVDDICHEPDLMFKMMNTFSKSFVPHKTKIMMMNYGFEAQGEYQRKIMSKNVRTSVFSPLYRKEKTCVFLYLGGEVLF